MKQVLGAFLLMALFGTPVQAADEQAKRSDGPFSYTINTLFFGTMQDPAHSTQNPDNAFLDLSRYSGEIDVRPDFYYDGANVSALFKPRFTSAQELWQDGISRWKTDAPSRAFVNEWRIQASPASSLFISFGKEKLLWGPSFLASPSNILFKDTEKVNPKAEVEGKYLAKAIYAPGTALTINVIAETQNDENDRGETLKPAQAVKADLMGGNYLVSLIGYHRQDDRFRMGSFGQWTASDALVLYYDGIVTKGSDALYPVEDPSQPVGGTFSAKYDDASRLFPTVTAGGSYTFLGGSTLSMEFLYNGPGYDDAEAAAYYKLRQSARDHFFDAGPLSGLSKQTLGESFGTGLAFLRRYYLMGQYHVPEIGNVLDVIVRYTRGLEEGAGQVSSIIEWRVSDRVSLFNVNMAGLDRGKEKEFNSLLNDSFQVGVEVHF